MKASSVQFALAATVLLMGCSSDESSAPVSNVPADQMQEPAQTAVQSDLQDNSPGPIVGERAQAFELQDQHGQLHSLASILASGNVAIVFYRSADW